VSVIERLFARGRVRYGRFHCMDVKEKHKVQSKIVKNLLEHTHTNKQSLVDYYVLSHEIQVIAFFLPEAPTEIFKIFHKVSFRSFTAF